MEKASVNKAAASTGAAKSKRKLIKSPDTYLITIDTTDLPEIVQQAIADVLRIVANGGIPFVTGDNEFLTTSEAAQILNVTRPTIISWIEDGRLSSHMIGTHRRLLVQEVQALRKSIRATQLSALASLLNA